MPLLPKLVTVMILLIALIASSHCMVETRPEEALRLENKVVCFQFHVNVAKAMGQASGTLAFLWILSSIMTWTSNALRKKLKKANKKGSLKIIIATVHY